MLSSQTQCPTPTHRFDGKTIRAVVLAGEIKNIDFKIVGAAGRTLNGGVFLAYNSHEDDEVTFQVVDVDNKLGYGPGIVLDEFLTWTVLKGFPMELTLPYSSDIPDGFYIRCIYKSVGTTDVKIVTNYGLHRPL